ncbi:D-sedoheptulose 7-phosphate isomerase [Acetobacter sp. AN02]|uniref:D-sedoheptulose 7-phosphate isomerase n=1 Tax=Acetobacter sp. AN02 TaxID=2894186 RepID=UPI0024343AD6|nr:D-sedoheptulose 7-phosphate isomerase [Acetobacter sp. AN02]MDG6094152.1 D-sedoheptulose 7-phosphate isomerase [Acetobacter sp. AN02]
MNSQTIFRSSSFLQEDRHFVTDFLNHSAEAVVAFREDETARQAMFDLAAAIIRSLQSGGRLLVAGNGGSAADAQHIAGEFTARLMYDRRPLAAIALTTDSSALTAIGNDYGFDHVFSRQVQALGRPGDVFLGISTSGRSPNVIRALEAAREAGLVCAAFTGTRGMQYDCDITVAAPSDKTAIIQQVHIIAAHIVCALAERALCPKA